MQKFAYKIENAETWKKAMRIGSYTGSELDINDGFIHLSTAQQFFETFRRYFSNVPNLIVAKIDLESLGEKVIFEPSRGGELFPHIYGEIPKKAVIAEMAIIIDENKNPIIPQDFFRSDENE